MRATAPFVSAATSVGGDRRRSRRGRPAPGARAAGDEAQEGLLGQHGVEVEPGTSEFSIGCHFLLWEAGALTIFSWTTFIASKASSYTTTRLPVALWRGELLACWAAWARARTCSSNSCGCPPRRDAAAWRQARPSSREGGRSQHVLRHPWRMARLLKSATSCQLILLRCHNCSSGRGIEKG